MTPFLPDNESYYAFYEEQAKLNSHYKLSCHIIPFVTLPVYAEAFYCVFYKCKHFSKKYVVLLQIHLFLHFFGELYWTILLIPVIVIPSIGVSADGFLSVLKISPSWQIIIMCGILQISTATMIHLLIFRLKFAIPPNAKYRSVIKYSVDFLNIFCYCTTIFCTCALGLLDEDQLTAKNRVYEKFPIPNPNLWDENYVTTDIESYKFKTYVIISVLEIFILCVHIIVIPIVGFHFLSKNQTEKSEKLAEAHRKTMQMLVFQLTVHCIFHLVPFVCFTWATIFKQGNIGLLSGGMFTWALHGAACTLTLLLANKPFRMTTLSHLKYVFCCGCCNGSTAGISKMFRHRRESTVVQMIDFST
ncbi:Serpentine Receptor, class H [Caenorhabditis elegans]|uniref:Serpentine Receptor, class H n=1 Tax=Caenorhabditis elegans TaxID=6239 RepID=P91841_CAEEL|nr:Serpentine Receptor, class H [Caenorhabditis elegans]CAB03479.2 Serpentine Receptor, class H [Caenorhabditis elegans]|eukprot:NP_496647.1 Serpentine Receptor, class H [Caenorhabditis elegans]